MQSCSRGIFLCGTLPCSHDVHIVCHPHGLCTARFVKPPCILVAGALIGTPILGAVADAASNQVALAVLVLAAGLVYTFFGAAARETAQLRRKDIEMGVAARSAGGQQPVANGHAQDGEPGP